MLHCGRLRMSRNLHHVVAEPTRDGLLLGSEDCTGIFWRGIEDSCAVAIPFPNGEIAGRDGRGVRAMVEHQGRLYVALAPAGIYELELHPANPDER